MFATPFFLFVYLLTELGHVAACRFFLVAASGGYSGFSSQWLLLLQSIDSIECAGSVVTTCSLVASCHVGSLVSDLGSDLYPLLWQADS